LNTAFILFTFDGRKGGEGVRRKKKEQKENNTISFLDEWK